MPNNIREELLLILPTWKENALGKDFLAEALEVNKWVIAKEVKAIRNSWVPILWNCKWIYIDYDHWAIKKQSRMIENMKKGFVKWMTKIQLTYKSIIDWDYD